jgi:hypothetical protein
MRVHGFASLRSVLQFLLVLLLVGSGYYQVGNWVRQGPGILIIIKLPN